MRLFLFVLTVLIVLPVTGFAGFEWVAPKENPTSEAPAPIEAAPVPEAMPSLPLPAMVEKEIPVQPQPAPPAPVHLPMPAPTMPPQQKPLSPQGVQGFGTDLPLVMALSEIVPPSYAYAFAPAVNPGVRVSWDGQGRPWNQVVSSMLAPLGLYAVVQGQRLFITHTLPDSMAVHQSMAISAPVVAIPAPAMPEKIVLPARPQNEIFVEDGIVDAGAPPAQLLPMP